MAHRIIKTKADLEEGTAALVAVCPHMAEARARTGPPPLRRRANGFPGLARIIVGQQLSVASASAIWGRVEAAVTPFEPAMFNTTGDDRLRQAGLSAGKIRTLRGIAAALDSGEINLKALARAPEERVREQLVALKGVGPWTADIYAMFCLGRADAWAPGDLALQIAVADAVGLEARPDAGEMAIIAERWRPWRSVAARLLWAWYAHRKALKAATPL